MGTNKKQIPRNQGRIEILASRETIESLVEQGFDKKKIFTRLKEQGAVTMRYSTFCRGYAKWLQPQKKKPAPASVQNLPVPSSRGSGPQILGSAAKKSVDPKTYADDNLI